MALTIAYEGYGVVADADSIASDTQGGSDKIVSTGAAITLDLNRPVGGYWLRINSIKIIQV